LAFFEPAEFDDLVALLAEKNKNYGRKVVNGADSRAGVPRKRTRFPGQHARCWYCGRIYYWGGNGNKGHLMCSGSHKYSCWNSIHIDGALALDRVRTAITDVLYQLEGFDDQFRELVEVAACERSNGSAGQLRQIEADEVQLQREKDNLLASIKKIGPKQMLLDEVNIVEARERDVKRRRYLVEKATKQPLQLPQTIAELRAELEAQFEPLNVESVEFGTLLRQLVPEFHVYLVRLIDGGHLMPRARIKVAYNGIARDVARVEAIDNLLTRVLTIDLFDPPQRERIREESVLLEAKGLQQREIAREIKERPKQAAVYNALALHREMLSQRLSSPYLLLREPPTDYSKLRRQRNSKYEFAPLDGYIPPEI
jgi:hypothetical protein